MSPPARRAPRTADQEASDEKARLRFRSGASEVTMSLLTWIRSWSEEPHQSGQAEAFALTDASIVHGAGRHYFDYHHNPRWQYAANYSASEDKILYHEFLHNILLYDRIFMDNACARGDEVLYGEVEQIKTVVNDIAGYELLRRDAYAPQTPDGEVLDAVCHALRPRHPSEDQIAALSTIRIPWYYATDRHVDYPACAEAADRWRLDPRLVPLALYIYRGICYSGWANNYHLERKVPTVYLASPGRLQALQPILSKEAIRQVEYPHSAYADLVRLLDLPSNGYDFSHLQLQSAHTSRLTRIIAQSEPREALEKVFEIRNSRSGWAVREQWKKRIWVTSASCAVGSMVFNAPANVLVGNEIYGNVRANATQYLYASA
jgi:hypothetical protein